MDDKTIKSLSISEIDATHLMLIQGVFIEFE
jgi:hypothetical protein